MAKGSGNIKGLTVEIAGDTQKLTTALKSVDDEGQKIGKDLTEVNKLLKLDPTNVEALTQKQQILTEAVKNSSERVSELKKYQEQIKQQFADGKIDRGAYLKFEQEVLSATGQLNSYQSELDDTNKAAKKAAKGIKQTGNNVKQAGEDAAGTKAQWDKFKSVVSGAAKAAAAAVATVSAAAIGVTKAVVDSANEVASYGDTIDKASQKVGVSAEFYQEWEAVLQHSGTSMSNMTTSFKTLANASQNASKKQTAAFEALGLSMEQVQSMSQEELFESVIAGLQNMEEGTERTATATALLGKGAMELGPLFNTSAEDTQAMIDTVNDLGGVMSNDAVKAAAAYQDAMQDLQTSIDGAKRNLIAQFLPAITTVMGGLTLLFSGQDGGIEQVNEGIKDFVDNLTACIPSVLDAGVGIITGLISAITGNLSALADAAVTVVLSLADGIVNNLPTVIEAGMQMILTLASGIADALPELTPTIVNVVLDIVDMLLDNVDLLIDAAIAIVTGLADGIIEALPVLLERAPEIIGKFVAALMEAIPKLLAAAVDIVSNLSLTIADALPQIIDTIGACLGEIYLKIVDGGKQWVESFEDLGGKIYDWVQGLKTKLKEAFDKIIDNFTEMITPALDIGCNIIEGIANGIKEGVTKVKDKIKGACDELLGGIKDFFGIHSPSKVFKEQVGTNLALGLSEGFVDKMDKLSGDMSEAVPSDYEIGVTVTDTASAKKAIDVIVKDYESGLLNRAQYDKLYNQTLSKCVKERSKVEEYANQKLTAADKKAAQNRQKEVLSIAKEQVNDIVKAYEDGEISLAEMNELYNQVCQTCADERVEIEEYANDKIAEARKKVAENNLKELKSTIKAEITEYQKQIDDIQKSIASTSKKLSGDISDMYSFETDDKGKMTAKLNDMSKKQQQLNQYYNNIKKLVDSGISDAMIEQLADMSLEQGAALAESWAKMSASDLNGVALRYDNISKTSDKISALLYDKKSKQVSEAMITSLNGVVAGSEEFAAVGGGIMDQMLAGLTNGSSTDKIKAACDNIVKAFADYLNIDIDTGLEQQLQNVSTAYDSSSVATIDGNTYGSMTRQELGGDGGTQSGGNTTIFNQYNTSPKALSRAEIAQDTKRQLQLASFL